MVAMRIWTLSTGLGTALWTIKLVSCLDFLLVDRKGLGYMGYYVIEWNGVWDGIVCRKLSRQSRSVRWRYLQGGLDVGMDEGTLSSARLNSTFSSLLRLFEGQEESFRTRRVFYVCCVKAYYLSVFSTLMMVCVMIQFLICIAGR